MISIVLNTITHGINLIKHSFKDAGIKQKRSSKWPTVEKHFKEKNPLCACCGSNIRVQVHHCVPFHINVNLELDPDNLISLCMSKNECHLRLGHGLNFKAYCPDIRKYAQQLKNKEKTFEELYEIAKNSRLYK